MGFPQNHHDVPKIHNADFALRNAMKLGVMLHYNMPNKKHKLSRSNTNKS